MIGYWLLSALKLNYVTCSGCGAIVEESENLNSFAASSFSPLWKLKITLSLSESALLIFIVYYLGQGLYLLHGYSAWQNGICIPKGLL